MLYTSPWSGFELTTSVVIGTDCMGKSNYHTITATTAPRKKLWMQNMPCGHKTFQFQKNPIRQNQTLCHDYQTYTPNTSNNKKKTSNIPAWVSSSHTKRIKLGHIKHSDMSFKLTHQKHPTKKHQTLWHAYQTRTPITSHKKTHQIFRHEF